MFCHLPWSWQVRADSSGSSSPTFSGWESKTVAQEHRSKTLGFEKIIEDTIEDTIDTWRYQNHSKSETGRNLQQLHLSVISPLVGIGQQEVLESQRCQRALSSLIVVSTGWQVSNVWVQNPCSDSANLSELLRSTSVGSPVMPRWPVPRTYAFNVVYIYNYIHNYTNYTHTYIHNITLHYIILHNITLHYITLRYITLHDMTWHDMTLHYINTLTH